MVGISASESMVSVPSSGKLTGIDFSASQLMFEFMFVHQPETEESDGNMLPRMPPHMEHRHSLSSE